APRIILSLRDAVDDELAGRDVDDAGRGAAARAQVDAADAAGLAEAVVDGADAARLARGQVHEAVGARGAGARVHDAEAARAAGARDVDLAEAVAGGARAVVDAKLAAARASVVDAGAGTAPAGVDDARARAGGGGDVGEGEGRKREGEDPDDLHGVVSPGPGARGEHLPRPTSRFGSARFQERQQPGRGRVAVGQAGLLAHEVGVPQEAQVVAGQAPRDAGGGGDLHLRQGAWGARQGDGDAAARE